MKGIILAAGAGTRLYPATLTTSKQLLPVYDKPMVFYPMTTLIKLGIRDIAIISTPHDLPHYKELFGSGYHNGLNIEYLTQEKPSGIAEAFIICEDFIGNDSVTLILGDNLFIGEIGTFTPEFGALIMACQVDDPSRYGVAVFEGNRVVDLVEKPKEFLSNYAVPGIYAYQDGGDVVRRAKGLMPSPRGELEITDLNRQYMTDGLLKCVTPDATWLDMGTHDSLLDAANTVSAIQKRTNQIIGCVEVESYRSGFCQSWKLAEAAKRYGNSTAYGRYIARILEREQA